MGTSLEALTEVRQWSEKIATVKVVLFVALVARVGGHGTVDICPGGEGESDGEQAGYCTTPSCGEGGERERERESREVHRESKARHPREGA